MLGVYICWYFWNGFDESQRAAFVNVFKEADYLILFFSLLIGFVSHLSRAYRWKYMLRPLGYEPPLLNSYNAIMIGYIANIVVPRMGEASRAGVLKGTDGVPFDKGFGTIVAERVIDVLCLGMVTGIAVLLNLDNMDDLFNIMNEQKSDSPTGEESTPWLLYTFIGVILAGMVGFLVLYLKNAPFRAKVKGFIGGFISGLKTIFTMKDRWGYLFHTLLIWTCYVGMFWVPFYAWEGTVDMPADGILSAFIAGTIGFIIVQGGLGTYPVMVGAVVTFFLAKEGMEITEDIKSSHVGFGALVWATQTVLIVVLGLISLAMVQKTKKKNSSEEVVA